MKLVLFTCNDALSMIAIFSVGDGVHDGSHTYGHIV